MNLISIITNEDFGLKPKIYHNPKIRIGARGIVIDGDKIGLFNKQLKNEYKLPGGGVLDGEDVYEAYKREILEETGCEVEIVKELGTIIEERSSDNFKQISHIFISKVIAIKETHFTKKEKDEGARVLWVKPEEALNLISNCFTNLKPSKYENLYHTRFIVMRDKRILEYYLKNK